MKVIRLIDEQARPSTMSWNMVQLLEEVIQDVKDGKLPDRGLVLFLDDSGGGFETRWLKAGLLNSEAVALVEIFKSELIEILRNNS